MNNRMMIDSQAATEFSFFLSCWNRLATGPCVAAMIQLVVVATACAQPTPQLHALNQHVGQVGTTFPVHALAVDNGTEIHRLVFSHPDIVARLLTEPAATEGVGPQPKYGHFEVSISPRVPPGIYDVAVVGRAGVSNPRAFVVTTSPVVIPEIAVLDSADGFELGPGRVVWDRFRGPQKQRYHLKISQPQSIAVTAEAQSLDSNAIPMLVLRNEQGIEVARGRAVKQSPAQILYTASEPGKYMLEVQDFLYQGGADFYYTLEAKVLETTPSEPATVAVTTDGGGETPPPSPSAEVVRTSLVESLKLTGDRRQRIPFREPAVAAAVGDWATRAGGLDFSLAKELSTEPTVHDLPVVLAGEFPDRSEPVRIDFKGNTGQVIWCEVVSAGAEQWTDPHMLLYRVNRDEQGTESLQLLTHQDDSPGVGTGPVNITSPDPAFLATLPEEGQYCVLVMDHVNSPRPATERQFVVSVGPPQPDFQLVAHPQFFNNDPAQARPLGVQVARGGTTAWHVHVLRRQGFAGAVEITVEGLPEGVKAWPIIVHPAVNQAAVVVQGDVGVTDWCGDVRIVGRAVGDLAMRRVAWPATVFQASSPRRNMIRWGLVSETRLQASGDQTAALGMTWTEPMVAVTPAVQVAAVLNLERREGGAGQGIVRPIQLPPGWTVSEVTIPPDQVQGTINIQVPAETPAGRYTISFHNETKIQWKPTTEGAAQEVPVWLPVPPLTIEVTPM